MQDKLLILILAGFNPNFDTLGASPFSFSSDQSKIP